MAGPPPFSTDPKWDSLQCWGPVEATHRRRAGRNSTWEQRVPLQKPIPRDTTRDCRRRENTKTDMESKRVVSRARAEHFATEVGGIICETSAKENWGVNELFTRV